MPSVKVKTASGTVNFHYVISTPREASAKKIDPQLPTVLWFHPVYLNSTIFHQQFLDLSLRKYNLIAVDARSHGLTTSSKPAKRFHDVDAAEEAFKFMEALKLPPCHVVGNCFGGVIALALAMLHPDRVLSLLVVAPLPPSEPEDVIEGREQILEYWSDGFRNGDDSLIQDATHGSLQLGTGHMNSPLIDAVVGYSIPIDIKNWGLKGLGQFKIITHDFFVDRKPHPRAMLAKINCPVRLAYCTGDVAYTREHLSETFNILQDAGVDVSQVDIPDAPHFAPFTHPREVNIIANAHLDMVVEGASRFPTPKHVQSPFEKILVEHGYHEDSDDEI